MVIKEVNEEKEMKNLKRGVEEVELV